MEIGSFVIPLEEMPAANRAYDVTESEQRSSGFICTRRCVSHLEETLSGCSRRPSTCAEPDAANGGRPTGRKPGLRFSLTMVPGPSTVAGLLRPRDLTKPRRLRIKVGCPSGSSPSVQDTGQRDDFLRTRQRLTRSRSLSSHRKGTTQTGIACGFAIAKAASQLRTAPSLCESPRRSGPKKKGKLVRISLECLTQWRSCDVSHGSRASWDAALM